MNKKQKIQCWVAGDRCVSCDHYKGTAPYCKYRPKSLWGRWTKLFNEWLQK